MLYEGASGVASLRRTQPGVDDRPHPDARARAAARGGRLDAAPIGAIVDRCLRKECGPALPGDDRSRRRAGARARRLGRRTVPRRRRPAATLADVAEPALRGSPQMVVVVPSAGGRRDRERDPHSAGTSLVSGRTREDGDALLFYAALVAGVIAVSLRLHLSFASRYRLPAFGRHRSRLHPVDRRRRPDHGVGADVDGGVHRGRSAPVWSIVFVIVALALVIALASSSRRRPGPPLEAPTRRHEVRLPDSALRASSRSRRSASRGGGSRTPRDRQPPDLTRLPRIRRPGCGGGQLTVWSSRQAVQELARHRGGIALVHVHRAIEGAHLFVR